jgi:hypothetical protein
MLKSGKTYGDRRGCAYGLAGITKGLGIGSLKQLGIMANIQVCDSVELTERREREKRGREAGEELEGESPR